MKSEPVTHRNPLRGKVDLEVIILAGGLSERMGRDKSRLRLGGRTLPSLLRSVAREAGFRARVIRRDRVPRCGPLGGILTALATTRCEGCLFLTCDMPFITASVLLRLVSKGRTRRTACFYSCGGFRGFPALLWRDHLPTVQRALDAQDLSFQSLTRRLRGRSVRLPISEQDRLFNINTPEDWEHARQMWRLRGGRVDV